MSAAISYFNQCYRFEHFELCKSQSRGSLQLHYLFFLAPMLKHENQEKEKKERKKRKRRSHVNRGSWLISIILSPYLWRMFLKKEKSSLSLYSDVKPRGIDFSYT